MTRCELQNLRGSGTRTNAPASEQKQADRHSSAAPGCLRRTAASSPHCPDGHKITLTADGARRSAQLPRTAPSQLIASRESQHPNRLAQKRRFPLFRLDHRQFERRTGDFQWNRRRAAAGAEVDPDTSARASERCFERGQGFDQQPVECLVGRRSRGSAVRLIFAFHCASSRK